MPRSMTRAKPAKPADLPPITDVYCEDRLEVARLLGIFHNLSAKPQMTFDQIIYDTNYFALEAVCVLRFARQFLLEEIATQNSPTELTGTCCLCPPLVERWACLEDITVKAKGLTEGKKLNGLEGKLIGRKVFPFDKKYYDLEKISPDEMRFCVDFGGKVGKKLLREKNLDIVTELKPSVVTGVSAADNGAESQGSAEKMDKKRNPNDAGGGEVEHDADPEQVLYQKVIRLRQEHGDWSLKQLGEALGVSAMKVKRLLGKARAAGEGVSARTMSASAGATDAPPQTDVDVGWPYGVDCERDGAQMCEDGRRIDQMHYDRMNAEFFVDRIDLHPGKKLVPALDKDRMGMLVTNPHGVAFQFMPDALEHQQQLARQGRAPTVMFGLTKDQVATEEKEGRRKKGSTPAPFLVPVDGGVQKPTRKACQTIRKELLGKSETRFVTAHRSQDFAVDIMMQIGDAKRFCELVHDDDFPVTRLISESLLEGGPCASIYDTMFFQRCADTKLNRQSSCQKIRVAVLSQLPKTAQHYSVFLNGPDCPPERKNVPLSGTGGRTKRVRVVPRLHRTHHARLHRDRRAAGQEPPRRGHDDKRGPRQAVHASKRTIVLKSMGSRIRWGSNATKSCLSTRTGTSIFALWRTVLRTVS